MPQHPPATGGLLEATQTEAVEVELVNVVSSGITPEAAGAWCSDP